MPPATAADAPLAQESARPKPDEAAFLPRVLESLASLRLTVVLFALAIFLVLVGTLAQVDHDIWYVVEKTYFRVWFASVEWQAFYRLAEMFTKAPAQPIAGGFWFPGGLTIGSLMFVNLLTAHAVRFKVAAKGRRLAWGLAVTALGVVATVAVIVGGLDQSLKGQLSPGFSDGLWQTLRASLAGVALLATWWCVQRYGSLRRAEWWLATAAALSTLGLAAYLFANPSVGPDPAGMRIVWQLTKCGVAAVLCLAGCWVVFRRRAGIVLLHAGIGLLMVGELVTHLGAVEGRMRIPEGATVNYADDIRNAELCVTTDEGDATRVTVVPDDLLQRAAASGEPIRHPDLPFDLLVVDYHANATLAGPNAGLDNPATRGAGLQRVAAPLRSVAGVGADQGVNLPAAYVEPVDRDSGESLGVWLASLGLPPQPVAVGEGSHGIELRFERTYKDYSITLEDFRFDKYVGTNVPKNYSSDVVLHDPSRGVERPVRIWMNNPLRYAGDTLYQSAFDDTGGGEATILQVVTNGGWMIPYVSCMLVGLGMLAHFLLTLTRFVRRRSEEAERLAAKGEAGDSGPGLLSPDAWRRPTVWAPALVGLLALGYFASKARPRVEGPTAEAVQRFAALPVAEGGRIKPIDTLARNTLQALSARQEVIPVDEDDPRLPASQWLLDVISDREGWRDHRVFRVENVELLDVLGLEPRPGSFRYSYAEVTAERDKLEEQVTRATEQRRRVDAAEQAGQAAEPLSVVQKQTLALADKLSLFNETSAAFGEPPLGGEGADIREQLMRAQSLAQRLRSNGSAQAVPPADVEGAWTTLYETNLVNLMRMATNQPPDEAGLAWTRALGAWAEGDTAAFEDRVIDLEGAVAKYQRALDAAPDARDGLAVAERLDAGKVRFERFFNGFSPFYYCAVMYLVAFVLTASGWLGQGGGDWPRLLARAAMAVILVTLVVHTFALVGRIYISGRPPVTNLYSSAVFIGWATVLFGVAFEAIYRLGVGSAVASTLGFATLVVAHYLSLDGDTFTVLQAVLDTQFWLATHVVCISLGYATTFLAGFLGLGYLLAVSVPRLAGRPSGLSKAAGDQIVRMTYGTLCFALLFSFVGTVLGGLWADDSWGRFWGWDPKENGALIIVLWNALVLHARWGRMVGPVGLATLAVGGNIVTTWSWFGVNELGVGLHTYGASDSSTTLWLLGFAASQAAFIAIGCLAPKPRWA